MGVGRILVAMCLVLSFIAKPIKDNCPLCLLIMFSSRGLSMSCAIYVLR